MELKITPLNLIAVFKNKYFSAWRMEGNEGLDAASHFIGTTDSTALVFRTNHQEAMRIEGDGDIEIEKGFKLKQLADPNLGAEKYQVPLLRSDGSFEIPSAWKIEYNPIQSRPCVRPADIAAWQFAATGETAADYDPEKIVYYGKVGINICNPTEELHVNGNATISNLLRAERVIAGEVAQFSSTSTVHISQIGNQPALFTKGASQENYNSLHRYSSSNAYTKVIASENQSDETFVVYGDGTTQIGAGTVLTPNEETKLAVNGLIAARELKILNPIFPWPDYVFSNDYKLKSLSELKAYIDENCHLPDIPL